MKDIYLKRQDLLDFDCLNEERLNRIGIKKDLVSIEDILGCMEDLLFENDRLEERIRDLENDIEYNYKPIDAYEMYGVSEKDFF